MPDAPRLVFRAPRAGPGRAVRRAVDSDRAVLPAGDARPGERVARLRAGPSGRGGGPRAGPACPRLRIWRIWPRKALAPRRGERVSLNRIRFQVLCSFIDARRKLQRLANAA